MGRSKKANGIFTALGAATGLGNALRFPSLCALYGGAFVFAYVVALIFVCFPLLCAELTIGKRYALSFEKSLRSFSPKLSWIAYSAAINSAVIALYYGVISAKLGGAFFLFATCGGTADMGGYLAFIFGVVSLLATWFILRGKGRRMARTGAVSVVGSLCLLFILAVAVLIKGGSIVRVFTFTGGDLARGGLWADALGQSLLALSLAGGVMPTFAREINGGFSVRKAAASIIAANLAGCLLAAVATCAFTMPVPEGGGVTVALKLYPQIIACAFGDFALGRVFGTLFFAVLWLVALQSACSLFSPAIALVGENRRNGAISLLCLCSLALLPLFEANGSAAMNAVDRMACSVNAVIIAFFECLAFAAKRNVSALKSDCGACVSVFVRLFCPVFCGALALFSACGARFSSFSPYAFACAQVSCFIVFAPALPRFAYSVNGLLSKRKGLQKS